MKVFSYYRTSSDRQLGNWKSQKLACETYIKDKDIQVIEEFVEEESAFKDRPLFESMLSRLGEVTGILVFDLDRLVRDPFQLSKLLTIFQDLKKTIFQVTGELDLTKEEDVLLARIKTDVAEYERNKMIRRIKSGIQRYKEEKGHWGRPSAKITVYMFEKYLENGVLIFPKTTIAKLFGVSSPTLRNWMKENEYGHLIEKQPEWLE